MRNLSIVDQIPRPFIVRANGQVVDRLNGNYVGHIKHPYTRRWDAYYANEGHSFTSAETRWFAAELLWERHAAERSRYGTGEAA